MTKGSGLHVWLVLRKAAGTIEAHASRSVAQLQMCPSDFAVLQALHQKGPLPVNTIGREILLTSGSITTAIHRLEHRGLVRRQWQQEDKRVCSVELTSDGTALIEGALRDHAGAMEKAATGLTVSERKELVVLLKKLGLTAQSLLAEKAEVPKLRTDDSEATSKDFQKSVVTPQETESASEAGFDGFTGLD